jgi:hypothetical protein
MVLERTEQFLNRRNGPFTQDKEQSKSAQPKRSSDVIWDAVRGEGDVWAITMST